MLLTTQWGQEAPFNNLCPIATDGSGRCLTGCAATATAQVFYYHKGPKNGMGSQTIYYPYGMTSGVAISVDFEKSRPMCTSTGPPSSPTSGAIRSP